MIQIQFNKSDNTFIFIPNEIFTDLSKLKYTSNQHYPFTISYYALITFLYYTSYYGSYKPTQADLKEFLGYNKDDKRLNYIIKKNGLLDLSGYTDTISDYPIFSEYDEFKNLEFITIDQVSDDFIKKYNLISNNYTIKYPIKSFYRTKEDYEEEELTGTFYYYENTIKVNLNVFNAIIQNNELGCTAFLIYLYIKSHTQLYLGYTNFSKNILIDRKHLINKIKKLRDFNFISVEVYRSYPDNDLSNIYRVLK